MDDLLRFLELVKTALGASDARMELGGAEPSSDNVVWAPFGPHRRVVAVFDGGVADRKPIEGKLLALCESFHESAEPETFEIHHGRAAESELERALDAVRSEGGAEACFVIDDSSPEIWTRSGSGLPTRVDTAIQVDEIRESANWNLRDINRHMAEATEEQRDRITRLSGAPEVQIADWGKFFRAAAAMHYVQTHSSDPATRHHDRLLQLGDQQAFLARGFASIYWLVAVFDADFSALHCEAAMIRALPFIEQRVLGLPPRRPPDGTGGKSTKLRLV